MTTFVYTYYDDIIGKSPLANRREPIIHSIASLRRYNTACKIYVYDTGLLPQDWHPHQDWFRFEVRRTVPFRFAIGYPLFRGRSVQKLWTLTEDTFDDGLVVSVSNNTIFLSDPEPESYQDHLWGGDREGLFVHNPRSSRSRMLLDRWKSLSLLAMEPGSVQCDMYRFNQYRCMDETAVMAYLLSQECPTTWEPAPEGVSVQIYLLPQMREKLASIKSLVLNESFVGADKVRFIASIKELSDATGAPLLQPESDPTFTLKDLLAPWQLREIKRNLGLDGTGSCQYPTEKPLWCPPLQEMVWMGH